MQGFILPFGNTIRKTLVKGELWSWACFELIWTITVCLELITENYKTRVWSPNVLHDDPVKWQIPLTGRKEVVWKTWVCPIFIHIQIWIKDFGYFQLFSWKKIPISKSCVISDSEVTSCTHISIRTSTGVVGNRFFWYVELFSTSR